MSTAGNPVVSLKPRKGRSWKRLRRIQIVCELESHFIPDADIARHLGITVPALHHIKICPEYQALKISKQTGIISEYEKAFTLTPEDIRQEMSDMGGLALRNVRKALVDYTNPYHMKASLDMLDRVPETSKISRMDHRLQLQDKLDTSKENLRAKELLAILAANDIPAVEGEAVVYKAPISMLEEHTSDSAPSSDDIKNKFGYQTEVIEPDDQLDRFDAGLPDSEADGV